MSRAELLARIQRARRHATNLFATAVIDQEIDRPAADLFDELDAIERFVETDGECDVVANRTAQ
jgi:hypothetical protein